MVEILERGWGLASPRRDTSETFVSIDQAQLDTIQGSLRRDGGTRSMPSAPDGEKEAGKLRVYAVADEQGACG